MDDNGDTDTTADDTITVYIEVTDVNEAPEFATETDTRTVAENTAAGEDIGDRFEATDPDGDHNLTYTLGGDDAASFNIDEHSGRLRTKTTWTTRPRPATPSPCRCATKRR